MFPIALAIPPILEGLSAVEALGVAGAVGAFGLRAYLGYEHFKDSPNPFGSTPSGNNDVRVVFGAPPVLKTSSAPVSPSSPVVVPSAPSMANVLSPSLDDYLRSFERQKATTQTLASSLSSAGTAVKERNDVLAQTAGVSPFLVNQVEGKAALDEIGFAVNAQSVVHAMIYETLDRNLSLISASLVALAQAVNVAPASSAQAQNALTPDYSVHLEKMAAAADSAKVVHDHAQTVRDIHDLDGVVVARMAPMEATAVKHVTEARTATDVNSDDYTNDLPSLPDLLPLLQFSGRESIFNPNFTDNGNPFSAKNLS